MLPKLVFLKWVLSPILHHFHPFTASLLSQYPVILINSPNIQYYKHVIVRFYGQNKTLVSSSAHLQHTILFQMIWSPDLLHHLMDLLTSFFDVIFRLCVFLGVVETQLPSPMLPSSLITSLLPFSASVSLAVFPVMIFPPLIFSPPLVSVQQLFLSHYYIYIIYFIS